MVHTLKSNKFLFVPYLAYLTVGAILMLCFNKRDLHLLFNAYYCSPLDIFFKYLTLLGDGFSSVFVFLILLWFSYRKAAMIIISYAASSLTTQVLKNIFFKTHPRPIGFFNGVSQLHVVKGVELYSSYSFPSGHSTSAMALCLGLGLLTTNKWTQLALIALGLLVCYSRVYLSEHFFEDTYFGSLIGTTFALLIFMWLKDGKDSNLRMTFFKRLA